MPSKAQFWLCECDWRGETAELLVAPNPFDPNDTIAGCPNCKAVGEFIHVCGHEQCRNPASGGYPMPDGDYLWRCYQHKPA